MKSNNPLYPIFLKVENLNILIVGGGKVALEKLVNILKSSPTANITVVAKEIDSKVKELGGLYSNIKLKTKPYHEDDLKQVNLLIAATNNRSVNEIIKRDAKRYQLLTNVVDDPELCDFYLGSVVTKGNLKLGISTNGKSPTLAKRLRLFFEDVIPDQIEDSAELLGEIRKQLKKDLGYRIEALNILTDTLHTTKSTKKEYKLEMFRDVNFDIYLN